MSDDVKPVRGRLLSLRDAADYLGINESKMRRVVARGEIAVVRRAGGRIEGIYTTACDAWIAKREQPARDEPARQAVDARMAELIGPVRRLGGHRSYASLRGAVRAAHCGAGSPDRRSDEAGPSKD